MQIIENNGGFFIFYARPYWFFLTNLLFL
jgi:hypothetical protein